MKLKDYFKVIAWLLFLLALPTPMFAQTSDEDPAIQTRIYSQEELDRLLAPIALYPDTLLSQVLMASTYPLEVVEADRWLKQNRNLTGDSLDSALLEKPWDVSVKSLCHFPDVLATMSTNLELTNDLGNAFLGQQEQVMDTIQAMRAKAQTQGNLLSTNRQKVATEEGAITIEPVTPDVVYVPAYDPCWVYGLWWYPSCAPLWFWYPGIVVGEGFFWGPAVFIGPLDFWCGFRWHRHQVFVNVNKTFVVRRVPVTRMHGGTEVWVHNPVHRRGIAYHSPDVARRFGAMQHPGIDARRSFRGFAPQGGRIAPAITPQFRPETGRPLSQPRSTGPSPRHFEQPVRQQIRPSFAPQRGNAFEGFGSSGREVIQHSERGHGSISGSTSGGASTGGGSHGEGGTQGGSQGGGPHGGGKSR